jgi:hypothetical protein
MGNIINKGGALMACPLCKQSNCSMYVNGELPKEDSELSTVVEQAEKLKVDSWFVHCDNCEHSGEEGKDAEEALDNWNKDSKKILAFINKEEIPLEQYNKDEAERISGNTVDIQMALDECIDFKIERQFQYALLANMVNISSKLSLIEENTRKSNTSTDSPEEAILEITSEAIVLITESIAVFDFDIKRYARELELRKQGK